MATILTRRRGIARDFRPDRHHRCQRLRRHARPGGPVRCVCANLATSTRACWPRQLGSGCRRWRDQRGLPARHRARAGRGRVWSKCCVTASERLHLSRVFPLGALTLALAGRDARPKWLELTHAGCVGFGQAEVPLANTQVLLRRLAVRQHLWLHRVAASAGDAPGQGRCGQRSVGHPHGFEPVCRWLAETIALHTIVRSGARHPRAGACVPHQQRSRCGSSTRQAKARGLARDARTSASTPCT